VQRHLGQRLAGDRDDVTFDELFDDLYVTYSATLIRTKEQLAVAYAAEPRAVQEGRDAVKETLVAMEAANKVMHREGRIHLI
jgi:hypothetical protein